MTHSIATKSCAHPIMTCLLQVEENLGISMVFTIVAAVIEKLNEYFDENTTNREEAKERALRQAEEAERV